MDRAYFLDMDYLKICQLLQILSPSFKRYFFHRYYILMSFVQAKFLFDLFLYISFIFLVHLFIEYNILLLRVSISPTARSEKSL